MAKITEVLEDLKVEIEKLLEKLYELNATEPDVQRCEKVFHENNIYRALDKLKQILNISDAGNKQKRKNTNVLGSRSKYRTRRLRTDEVKDNVTNKAPGIMCFTSERKDSVYKCSSELEERIEGNERLYKSEMQDDKTGGILSSNIEGIQYKQEKKVKTTLECDSCDLQFMNRQDLREHKKSHEKRKTFECSLCKKNCKSNVCLKRHLQTHIGLKEHLCGTCGKSYKTSSHLKEHIRIHTGEKPFVCSICGKAFTQAGVRKAHERAHKNTKQYQCNLCKKSYKNKCSLTIHLRKHAGTKPYQCSYCGKAFNQQQNLTVHLRIHSGERPYSCTICGKSFTAAATYRKHKFSHESTTPYHCDQCGKYFTTNTKLKKHVATHKKKLFICEFCKGKFRKEMHFKNHIARCQTKKLELKQKINYEKDEAVDENVTDRNKTKKYKKRRHSIVEQLQGDVNQEPMRESQPKNLKMSEGHCLYKCLKCGYHFAAEDTLSQHQFTCVGVPGRSEHSGPCSCSYCGIQFNIMSDLLSHFTECYPNRHSQSTVLSYHSLETSNVSDPSVHECYECRQRFHSIDDLERHYEFCYQTKSIDLSNVPYKCAYCGHLYMNMQELSKHENECQEAPDMNLTCVNCLQKFDKLAVLKSHQIVCPKAFMLDKVHVVKCSECDFECNSSEELAAHKNDCGRLSNVEISYCTNEQPKDLHFNQ